MTDRGHRITILSVAVWAFLLASLAHEAAGHGLACLAMDGTWMGVSTSFCECDEAGLSEWALRFTKANGTLVNLGLGAALLAALRLGTLRLGPPRLRSFSPATRYFFWLAGTVNLLQGAGYLLVDPLAGFGDWTRFLEGLDPNWRWGLSALGLLLYLGAIGWSLLELEPFLGPRAEERRLRGRALCLPPYLVVAGVLMSAAALLNYADPAYAVSSAAATLGGSSALAWMYQLRGGRDRLRNPEPVVVEAHRGWILAGGVGVLLAALFGRGLQFSLGL